MKKRASSATKPARASSKASSSRPATDTWPDMIATLQQQRGKLTGLTGFFPLVDLFARLPPAPPLPQAKLTLKERLEEGAPPLDLLWPLVHLARAYLGQLDFAEARVSWDEAQDIYRSAGDQIADEQAQRGWELRLGWLGVQCTLLEQTAKDADAILAPEGPLEGTTAAIARAMAEAPPAEDALGVPAIIVRGLCMLGLLNCSPGVAEPARQAFVHLVARLGDAIVQDDDDGAAMDEATHALLAQCSATAASLMLREVSACATEAGG